MSESQEKARTVLVLKAEFVNAVRAGLQFSDDPALVRLREVLAEQRATIGFSQADEFAFHLASAEAHGVTDDAFRAWTRTAMAMPPARAKLSRTFVIASGAERVYGLERAQALETAFRPFEGGDVIETVRIDRQGEGPKVPQAFFSYVSQPAGAS